MPDEGRRTQLVLTKEGKKLLDGGAPLDWIHAAGAPYVEEIEVFYYDTSRDLRMMPVLSDPGSLIKLISPS